MRFIKMHGIGNDYVYVNGFTEHVADPAALARAVSHRHFGIGSDGLILVLPSDTADVRMRMFNADGSESEMCGNGVRCVARFAHDRLGIRSRPMRVETGRGILPIDYATRDGRLIEATVDMGEPILDLPEIPVDESQLAFNGARHHWGLELSDGTTEIATFVSMGNPHAVVFERQGSHAITLEELRTIDLHHVGPLVEHHKAFPRRINVHYVAVHNRREATMRTWERGSGITQACGTGACAVLAAGVLTGRLDREAHLYLPGGDLRISWHADTNHLLMTGPATEVFSGEWPDAP